MRAPALLWLTCFVLVACDRSDGPQRAPATAAPVPPTAEPVAADIAPCDPVVAALAQGFQGTPTRTARPGGCGVQVEAPRRPDADPTQLVRSAYPDWTEDRAQAAAGPEGERFTLERDGVQCTTTFAWGPMGARADSPWVARVDCSRRPGR